MKTIFFGSSNYCLPILDSLINFQLIAVITKPESSLQSFASSHDIRVFTPQDRKELSALKNDLEQLQPDLAVVADYGLIIPRGIFEIPKYKTLNIHFSRLPDLRGPSPVQFTILKGEKSAWITVIIMAKEMDTGDIIWQKEIPLNGDEIGESLYIQLFTIAAENLPEVLKLYVQDKLKPKKQNHSKATYTKLLTREDGFIPPTLINAAMNGLPVTIEQMDKWVLTKQLSSQLTINNYQLVIERAIRAFTPWPGVWTELHLQGVALQMASGRAVKKRIKILKAHIEIFKTIQDRKPKTIQDRKANRKAKLILDIVQLEGKKPVSWKQFQEGYPHYSF